MSKNIFKLSNNRKVEHIKNAIRKTEITGSSIPLVHNQHLNMAKNFVKNASNLQNAFMLPVCMNGWLATGKVYRPIIL
jgi:hypothetical protein